MNTKKPIFELPLPSTDFATEAFFHDEGSVAIVRYGIGSGTGNKVGGIKFFGVSAFKKTIELCCSPWHIEVAYDMLVEVEDSTWRKEVWSNLPERHRDNRNAHHYMIYLDSSGCFEVLAESWQVLPT